MYKTLSEYIENKENEEVLKENVMDVISSALGFTTAGIAVSWIVSLIILAASKGIAATQRNLKQAAENTGINGKNFIELKEKINELKQSPSVKNQTIKTQSNIKKYAEILRGVYDGIDSNDYLAAGTEYKKLSNAQKAMPAINDTIIAYITKKEGMVPVSKPTPGNTCYQNIRKVCGIRVAKAASLAVEMSLERIAEKDDEE